MEEPSEDCSGEIKVEVIKEEEPLELFFCDVPFDCDQESEFSIRHDDKAVSSPTGLCSDKHEDGVSSRDLSDNYFPSSNEEYNARGNPVKDLLVPTKLFDCGSLWEKDDGVERLKSQSTTGIKRERLSSDSGGSVGGSGGDKRTRYDDDTESSASDKDDPVPAALLAIKLPIWTVPAHPCMRQIEFNAESKMLVPFPGRNIPADWFALLLEKEFMEIIVEQTNVVGSTQKSYNFDSWTPLDITELRTFIGIFLHMGTIKCNRLKDYWSTDPLFSMEFIREKMSLDRFYSIFKALKFSPHAGAKSQANALTRRFNDVMTRVYYPSKDLVVEEGILSCKVVSAEQNESGFKLYSLSETCGLVVSLLCENHRLSKVIGPVCQFLETDIIKKLMASKESGHSLIVSSDNLGYAMAKTLLEANTFCTGYLREDSREIPAVLKMTVLGEGDTVARYANGVVIGKWRARFRDVFYITTETDNILVKNDEQMPQKIPIPAAILKHKNKKHLAEVTCPLLQYNPMFVSIHFTTLNKTFLYLLQILMLNAYKLCKLARRDNTMDFHRFRIEVIRDLTSSDSHSHIYRGMTNKVPRTDLKQQSESYDDVSRHELSKIHAKSANGRVRRRRCKMCSFRRKFTQTTFLCRKCPGQPALCAIRCFEAYHRALETSQ